jgi:hypothetical protein
MVGSRLLPRHVPRLIGLLIAAGSLPGCGGGDTEQALAARMAETQRLSAEKDSLIRDVVENAQFIQSINAEMDRVRRLPVGVRVVQMRANEDPITVRAYRDSILAQIRDLATRLEASEARLASAKARLGTPDSGLVRLVEQYRTTIAQTREQLEAQQAELVSLQQEVRTLRRQVRVATEERDRVLTEQASSEDRYLGELEAANTVYYIARSRAQLKELQIVEETGGGLFGRGKILIPSRQLNAADFTPLSKKGNREITLPNPAKSYTIVSSHNPTYLTPVGADRTVRGSFRITDPDRFWEPGKYLILVER